MPFNLSSTLPQKATVFGLLRSFFCSNIQLLNFFSCFWTLECISWLKHPIIEFFFTFLDFEVHFPAQTSNYQAFPYVFGLLWIFHGLYVQKCLFTLINNSKICKYPQIQISKPLQLRICVYYNISQQKVEFLYGAAVIIKL